MFIESMQVRPAAVTSRLTTKILTAYYRLPLLLNGSTGLSAAITEEIDTEQLCDNNFEAVPVRVTHCVTLLVAFNNCGRYALFDLLLDQQQLVIASAKHV